MIVGLLKISSLLSFMAIFGLFILEIFNIKVFHYRNFFYNPKMQIIPIAFVFIIQITWYYYANQYNEKYNNGIFLIGIIPIWELGINQIQTIFKAISEQIKWNYFRVETQIIFLLMYVLLITFFKKLNKQLLYLTILISL
ncbi:MAG: hypothetical protein A2046_05785 [Bacteroidetes bacterium GWA2_30_7]|nr:MAG: hypothetical protein A2046_05785 [Bacteroidetes bacterium GWA2_30_7]